MLNNNKIYLPQYTSYLEIVDSEPITINYSIAEVKNIEERSSSYSTTYIIPGTDNNNKLFGHIFNVNTFDWTFDINTKTKAIILNGEVTVYEGIIKLNKITKNNENTSFDTEILYEVQFFDTSIDFFERIKNSKLSDLDLSDYGHFLNVTEITSSVNNTYLDGYTYPLLQRNAANDYWEIEEFRPAIFIKTIFDRIFFEAGFGYESSFLESDRFKNLLLINNAKIVNQPDDVNGLKFDEVQTGSILIGTGYTSTAAGINNSIGETYIMDRLLSSTFEVYKATNLEFNNELLDENDLFDKTTGQYVPDNYSYQDFKLSYTVNVTIENPTSNFLFTKYNKNSNHINAKAYLVEVGTKNYYLGGVGKYSNRTIKAYSTTRLTINANRNFSPYESWSDSEQIEILFPNVFLEKDKIYEIMIGVDFNTKYQEVRTIAAPSAQKVQLIDTPVYYTATTSNYQFQNSPKDYYAENAFIHLESLLPKEKTQAEFISSLCKIFNLYIDIDKARDNTFVIEPRNEFYNTYKTTDWTEKLDTTTLDLELLSDLQEKNILFKYTEDGSELQENYFAQTNETYGEYKVEFDNQYLEGEKTIENMFSLPCISQYANTTNTTNIVVPSIYSKNEDDVYYITNFKVKTGNTWSLKDVGSNTLYPQTNYVFAGHVDDYESPEFTLAYSWPLDLNYSYPEKTENNAYNLYWSQYIFQIANGKLLTAYFDLDDVDIINFKFSDRIWVRDCWYVINRIIDYSPNYKSITQVELIQINEGFVFNNSTSRLLSGTSVSTKYNFMNDARSYRENTTTSLNKINYQGHNTILNSTNLVKGTNNVVYSKEGGQSVISGDGNYVDGPNKSIVIGSGNKIKKSKGGSGQETDSIMILGDNNYVSDEDNVIAIIGNTYITTNGVITKFNVVDGGQDITFNSLRKFPENLIDGGQDAVRGVEGNSIIEIIDGGQDATIGRNLI